VLRRERHRPQRIERRPLKAPKRKVQPAIVLVQGFAALIALGTVLLMLPWSTATGEPAPLLTALFTSTSAVCVTGLAVVDTGTFWSPLGQTIVMLLIQLGGLGIMTGATLLFVFLGKRVSMGDRMVAQEALGTRGPGAVVGLVKRIAVATLAIEAVGAILLLPELVSDYGGLDGARMALFHAISAFNNAGFDLFGGFRSLASYQSSPYVLFILGSLIAVGGLGYIVLEDVFKRRSFSGLTFESKLVLIVSVGLWLLGAILVFSAEAGNPDTMGALSWSDKIVNSLFHSASYRTAGFSTLPMNMASDASQFFALGLMFIGGAAGSTAGGIKVGTFAVLLLAVLSALRGQSQVGVFRRAISFQTVSRALVVVALAAGLVMIVTLLLSFVESKPFLWLLFEVTSAVGTVGLSTGITPDLAAISKVALIVAMFAGRVGLLAAVTLLTQSKPARVKYGEDYVRIG
jgi:trk system potassium uptake protein TrkH